MAVGWGDSVPEWCVPDSFRVVDGPCRDQCVKRGGRYPGGCGPWGRTARDAWDDEPGRTAVSEPERVCCAGGQYRTVWRCCCRQRRWPGDRFCVPVADQVHPYYGTVAVPVWRTSGKCVQSSQ